MSPKADSFTLTTYNRRGYRGRAMSGELHKVAVGDLRLGMYIARLDRPWTDTPFLFQGFYLHHDDEIDLIQRYCQHVFVDGERSQGSPDPDAESRTITRVTSLRSPTAARAKSAGRQRVEYKREAAIEYELPAARAIYEHNAKAAEQVMRRLRETGYLHFDVVEQAVSQVMDSVLRNPDTMVWLTRLRSHDEYVYQHSINSSIWALAFGRHLGLDRQSIYEIGLGAMLQDVGKTSLSPLLVSKPGPLTEAEMRVMRSHVSHSVAIIRNTPGVTRRMSARLSGSASVGSPSRSAATTRAGSWPRSPAARPSPVAASRCAAVNACPRRVAAPAVGRGSVTCHPPCRAVRHDHRRPVHAVRSLRAAG